MLGLRAFDFWLPWFADQLLYCWHSEYLVNLFFARSKTARLIFALRDRNTKNRNRLRLLDKRGGFSEDRSNCLDLDHSKMKYSEATLEVFRVRIGGYALDVNNHLMENTDKMNFSFKIID